MFSLRVFQEPLQLWLSLLHSVVVWLVLHQQSSLVTICTAETAHSLTQSQVRFSLLPTITHKSKSSLMDFMQHAKTLIVTSTWALLIHQLCKPTLITLAPELYQLLYLTPDRHHSQSRSSASHLPLRNVGILLQLPRLHPKLIRSHAQSPQTTYKLVPLGFHKFTLSPSDTHKSPPASLQPPKLWLSPQWAQPQDQPMEAQLSLLSEQGSLLALLNCQISKLKLGMSQFPPHLSQLFQQLVLCL